MKQNKLYQIKVPEGIVHYDDIGKANLLNEYFTSVFTVDTAFEEYANLDNRAVAWPKYAGGQCLMSKYRYQVLMLWIQVQVSLSNRNVYVRFPYT